MKYFYDFLNMSIIVNYKIKDKSNCLYIIWFKMKFWVLFKKEV